MARDSSGSPDGPRRTPPRPKTGPPATAPAVVPLKTRTPRRPRRRPPAPTPSAGSPDGESGPPGPRRARRNRPRTRACARRTRTGSAARLVVIEKRRQYPDQDFRSLSSRASAAFKQSVSLCLNCMAWCSGRRGSLVPTPAGWFHCSGGHDVRSGLLQLLSHGRNEFLPALLE